MPTKLKATKTVNPLHFEDLEPHRFEDLVRRLLYGFRDWRDIEATGRSGSDEGFDIRAWERAEAVTNVSEQGEEGAQLSEGNLWQVQGKREKSISPGRLRTIINEDIDAKHPPYGYILAAATNISKKAYDIFREQLRVKGVREFHFWGKDHLEDQLARPENDEILFTFFGISLSPRRRARTTEIKFSVNNKNKILRLLLDGEPTDGGVLHPTSVLLRDVKDQHYPYKGEYADFDKLRRWEEHKAVQVDATGVLFKAREWYAYLDLEKKAWDCSMAVDLLVREHALDEKNAGREQDICKKVEHFWRHLPLRFQAKMVVYGFVKYEDMLVIDEKGDPQFAMPHIFVDFSETHRPFAGTFADLVQGQREPIHSNDFEQAFTKIRIFPEAFPEPKRGRTHELAALGLTEGAHKRLQFFRGCGVIYSFDDKLAPVAEGDIIHLPEAGGHGTEKHLEVTQVSKTNVAAVAAGDAAEYQMQQMAEYAGRKVAPEDYVTVYEVCEVHTWGKYLTYQDYRDTWG